MPRMWLQGHGLRRDCTAAVRKAVPAEQPSCGSGGLAVVHAVGRGLWLQTWACCGGGEGGGVQISKGLYRRVGAQISFLLQTLIFPPEEVFVRPREWGGGAIKAE